MVCLPGLDLLKAGINMSVSIHVEVDTVFFFFLVISKQNVTKINGW